MTWSPAASSLTTGEAEPSIVALHGFGDEPADVASLAYAITPPGRSAYLPRMRGSGLVHDDLGWSPAHIVGDLHSDCLGLGRHSVVGYSYGGTIAALYALLMGPLRVSALIVVDQAFGAQPKRIEDEPWSLASDLLWHFDYTHHLVATARLGIPTLLVLGADSHVVPLDEAEAWLSMNEPGLEVVQVPGNHSDLIHPSGAGIREITQFLSRFTPEN